MKGYLTANRIAFKFVHELAYLVRLCMTADAEFSALLDCASELQDYATDIRYPSEEMEPPTLQDAREAVQRAETIRSSVCGKLEKP